MTDASRATSVLFKSYELRTEPALRTARAWFTFEFHPTRARDVLARAAANYPDYFSNLERVVGPLPDPDARVAIFERYLRRQRALAEEGRQRRTYRAPARAEPSSQPAAS